MKKKNTTICLFVIFALPIPIAMLGVLLSFIWLFRSLINAVSFVEIMMALIGIIIGATYIFTYIYSLQKTKKEKKISFKTFMPMAHCLLAFVFLLSFKPTANYISQTKKYFGFAKKDFLVVEELDTHGGFLGDGSYYLILDCFDNKEKALKTIESWNKLPLSENLNLIMYGGEKDGISYGYSLAEKAKIPKVENGYYIFKDRHMESNNSKDDSELLNRYSYNFSIAIYDSDTDRMYYFKFDT